MDAQVEGLSEHRGAIERLLPFLDAIRSIAEISWRRAEGRGEPLTAYVRRLEPVLQRVASSIDGDERARLLGDDRDPVAILFVTADRGLCGAFSAQLVAYGLRRADDLRAQGRRVAYLCLGARGRRALEAAGRAPLYAKPLPSFSVPTYVEIEEIALDLLDLRERGQFARLDVVHHAPVRRFQYQPSARRLLPPELAMSDGRPSSVTIKPSGDAASLLTHLLTEHLLLGLYRAVLESSISEQLARVTAMRRATENARRLLDDLTFAYQAARNNAITNSLLDVVSGYEASRGGGVALE